MVIGIHDACWEETNNEKCNFPATNVLEETLKCQDSDKLIYQGRIVGTKNTSPGVILDYINKWIMSSTGDSSAISIKDGDTIYVFRVDKTCPSYLPSPKDPNCTPDLNNTITTSDLLSLMAIILMIILMIMLTVAHFISALKYNEKYPTCNYNYKLNKC